MKTDILIIGSGLAGMATALYLAELRPELQILIVSKAKKDESNTKYAQGGIAGVVQSTVDSFEQHIEDTMKAGHFLSDRKIVELVVKSAPKSIHDLERWGVNFDYKKEGTYELGLEGGHSKHRILHHKDSTGKEIYDKLNQKVKQNSSIQLINNCTALELFKNQNNEIEGALFLNIESNQFFNITAPRTILASGGIGRVFGHTSNPEVATADGLAMAIRAGAELSNMHFVQFHPTLFYKTNRKKSFLISEALRGFGGYLVNKDGYRFMHEYDERAELSPRDVVTSAIFAEMNKLNSKHVFLDCRHLDERKLKNSFPFIYSSCLENSVDPAKDLIPVIPASHYHCGGVKVDVNGKTNLLNLYAVGEVAETGLHGANRLASNSLLEAVVFGRQVAESVVNEIKEIRYPITSNLTAYSKIKDCQNQEYVVYPEEKSLKLTELIRRLFIETDSNRKIIFKENADKIIKELTEHYIYPSKNVRINELLNMSIVAGILVDSLSFYKAGKVSVST
ncbi:L-aspartate oxidase [Marivirga tractuosa]|uniref:L-aspartate oxidase n=1 Tax=Marivirga tractuosa (strain ATCC 23168 / DSM 4126 / NBRC 15989 / NCIMB 1408 / VKM B-1430 / H-43) TaxID=643867 RepID=E4TR18_MARTH|nr:L-aspartate oxidase [Marivirga tractuosa]ADR22699.1 fumarate reductase/succinate dehydrogenase flavoprotein domain protein [Marivirga tractuosa DSM 4126]BDD16630.1 L-aspartate oxidase [Marivirga tractuosa]